MSIELKIKAKHLALEPKVIRHEEEKLKRQIRYEKVLAEDKTKLIRNLNNLVEHRKWDVRNEARATHLARAFLAGRPYNTVEIKRKDEYLFSQYIIPRIVTMVNKYRWTSNNIEVLRKEVTRQDIVEWAKIN